MEAAIILAKRGFKPVLFEKQDELGGSVRLGSNPPLKEKLKWLIENMTYEMELLSVDVRKNTPATVEELKKLNPYSIFVASGAEAIIPKLPGHDKENVYTINDILSGKVNLKDKKVIVVGSGLTGLETAEYLSEKGNKVDVIEMLAKIGSGAYLPNLYDVTTRLKKMNVSMMPSTKLLKISDTGIVVQNTSNLSVKDIECDAVVLSLGVKINDEFLNELYNNFDNVKVLGDAEKPGRIGQAIQTGYEKAYVLD
jgi:NADPH-dependent 2,4-dienoyl-CoA reductase/sulfur reductase-like enzyme